MSGRVPGEEEEKRGEELKVEDRTGALAAGRPIRRCLIGVVTTSGKAA